MARPPPTSTVERRQRNAFGVIYGSVTVMALILSLPEDGAQPVKTAVMLFGSVLAITLAKVVAQVSSDAMERRRPFRLPEYVDAWRHASPILLAANLPTAMIAFAALGIYSVPMAILLAELTSIALLGVDGYSIGRVVYGRVLPGLIHSAFTSGIGVGLALLKFALH